MIATDGVAVGEVVVRGATVFAEYWRNPTATADSRLAASDGGAAWFRTGDLAVVNDRGFVNVISRVKDMIVSGGENIYATEVENAISAHEAVTMVAVVGVPDGECSNGRLGLRLTVDRCCEQRCWASGSRPS